MTAATDDIDRRIVAFLRRGQQRDEAPSTVWEISEALLIPVSSVRVALNRLAADSRVRKAGVASNNARTWTCTGDPT